MIYIMLFWISFSNLVTQYRLGQHTPEIAESWSQVLTIPNGISSLEKTLKFSNGDDISPKIIVASLLRGLKNEVEKSNSGFFFWNF